MPQLLVFAGSSRAQSFNRRLAAQAVRMAKQQGASVTHMELADFDIPLYNADLEAQGTPPDVLRLKALMYEHPGWIICSPEYNGGMTALLKNTLDWASSPVKTDPVWREGLRSYRGKVVGLLSASPGALGGLRSLMQVGPLLRGMGCWVAPTQFALGQAKDAFDDSGRLVNPTHEQRVGEVLEQVLFAAQRLSAEWQPSSGA
jgi:chromate reductase, NAD(P)H dehydrogenase (quinone)